MHRRSFHRILILALTMSLAAPVAAPVLAQEKKASYIVVMGDLPVAAYDGRIAGYAKTKPEAGKKLNAKSAPAQKYKNHLRVEHNDSLQKAGVSTRAKLHDYTVSLNGYAAMLTPKEADSIKLQKGVTLVLEDQRRYAQTDSSAAFLGLTAKGGAYDTGYTGEGVVVGVIDTGIWPEHPSFADDGSYPTPDVNGPIPCEFGNTAANPADAPFTCNDKLVGAYQFLDTYRALVGADPDEFDSARDDEGHGTHTASTAAGNANVDAVVLGQPAGRISGIAPRAQVIAYKALGNGGGFTSDLAAAIDQAVEDGVDVINYSIGGGAGNPAADEIAFLFAADAGVFVATSAGNSGPGASTVGNPGTMPWLTTVGASTQSRFFEGEITLGNGKKYTGASLTHGLATAPLVDAAAAGDELCTGALDAGMVAGKIVLCKRGVTGRASKGEVVYKAGGIGMILFNASDADNLFTDTHWVPTVHIDYTPGLAIKAYIASSANPTANFVTRDKNGDPKVGKWKHAPSMTIFSSRGPNAFAPDIIKPDVTAPGLQILAGASPYTDAGFVSGELFQSIAGTSMSSPEVAGVYALLKQAHPEWSAAAAKSALMTTASPDVLDNDRTNRADPFDMGAGHITPGGKWDKGSVAQPGLVYDAGFFEYLGFLCEAYPAIFSNAAATCGSLAGAGIPTTAVDLNLASIGVSKVVGSQTITRTVTSVTEGSKKVTYVAKVSAPPGYTVTVSPSSLKLAGGESASFTVTITNVSAPMGAWRFGSLTWDGGGYRVRSPIAVQGALFQAPESVSGTGASGSLDFDVRFGYTGPYTAGAHGLVAATVTHATVQQDVDQDFAPSDAGVGANVHEFALSGVQRFRLAMPPEATEAGADLDVFVYDPAGDLAAESTAGGTDELIDIVDPMDGTWKVYVHGWQTVGGSSDYDMWSWAIPAATGGNLSIDSAPASATNGASGTVEVSWTGLTTGLPSSWYMGVVSHNDSGGRIAQTVVDVDNR